MSTHYPSLPDAHTPASFARAVLAGDYPSERKRARLCPAGSLVVASLPLEAGVYAVGRLTPPSPTARVRLEPLDPTRAAIVVPHDTELHLVQMDAQTPA